MMNERILLSFYLILLILGVNLEAAGKPKTGMFEYYESYKKLLSPTLFFKSKRLKQLEVLAAYYIQKAIDYAKEINLEVEPEVSIKISENLKRLISIICKWPEAKEKDVKNAKLHIEDRLSLNSFSTRASRSIGRIRIYQEKYKKLDRAQSEGFLRALLPLLNQGYEEIINAIDKLGKKTILPRELTIKTLSSFSSRNGPSRAH